MRLTPESKSEPLEIGNGEEIESDDPAGNTIEIVPEEPPTFVLLAMGIVVLAGIGQRSRIARYLRSLSFQGVIDYPEPK